MAFVSFPSTQGIEFEWEGSPTPTELSVQLGVFEEYFGRLESLAIAEEKEVFQQDMEARFHLEEDPDGRPWAPLVKEAPNQQGILQLSGAMRDAAISDAAWVATPEGVFFNTSALPPYWVYHDQPSLSSRSAGMRRHLYSVRQAKGVMQTREDKRGRGHSVPQRKFIGVSAEAADRAVLVADQWLGLGIDSAFRVRGAEAGGIDLGSRGFQNVGMGYYEHPVLGRRFGFVSLK